MQANDPLSSVPGGAVRLPAGFEELEPYLDFWAVDTCHERWMRRSGAPMQEIQRFYDAMFARADDAIAYLDRLGLSPLPAEAQRLAQLLLALAQAAIAVEMHEQPRSPHSAWPHNIRIVNGPWPLGSGIGQPMPTPTA